MTTPDDILAICRRFDALAAREVTSVTPLSGGWTNSAYRIDTGDDSYVLRTGNPDALLTGVNRSIERKAAEAASSHGISPELVGFLEDDGHMLTRRIPADTWMPGRKLSSGDIDRIAAVLRRIHAIPFHEGEDFCQQTVSVVLRIQERGGQLPTDLEHMLDRIHQIARHPALNPVPQTLCHSDLTPNNIIDAGDLYIIDWEYARAMHPLCDLACVIVEYDLDREAEERLLVAWDGEGRQDRELIEGFKFVYLLEDALWCLLQQTFDIDDARRREIETYLPGQIEVLRSMLATGIHPGRL